MWPVISCLSHGVCEVDPASLCSCTWLCSCTCFTRDPSTHLSTDAWIPAQEETALGTYSTRCLFMEECSLESLARALKQWKISPTAPHLLSLGGNEWEDRKNNLIKVHPSITASHNIPQTNFNSVWKLHELHNLLTWGKKPKKLCSCDWSTL